jgi:hypothetical protein
MSDLSRDRARRKPLWIGVHDILWSKWDPIGVNGLGPDDEYDDYIGPIISKLAAGASVDEIFAYLNWVTADRMELQGNLELNTAIARQLVALNTGLKE